MMLFSWKLGEYDAACADVRFECCAKSRFVLAYTPIACRQKRIWSRQRELKAKVFQPSAKDQYYKDFPNRMPGSSPVKRAPAPVLTATASESKLKDSR
jgi:hypothetical protein